MSTRPPGFKGIPFGFPPNYHKPSKSKFKCHHTSNPEYPKIFWKREWGTCRRKDLLEKAEKNETK